MAILVILVLAVLWGAVLLPPILRSRAESGSPSGIGDFVHRLRAGLGHRSPDASLPPRQPIMGPVAGPPPGMTPLRAPGAMTPVQRRRRDVLLVLLGAAAITLLMGLLAGSVAFWVLHLMVDVLLLGYVYMLRQLALKARMRRPTGRPVPAAAAVPSNVHHLDLTRRREPQSHVGVPREATVLALRRTSSAW